MNLGLAATPKGRYQSIDVMRGVAVMGILAMNIVNFALPEAVYSTPVGPMSDSAADRMSWLIAYLLFDGKMMGLFTMLFGASAMLMMERREAAGAAVARRHFRRMVWLLIFGLIHLVFIWRGDILFYYALCGFLLYFARFGKTHQLLVAGTLLVLATSLLSALLGWTVWDIAQQGGTEAADMVRELSRDFGYDRHVYAHELSLYRGDYAGILSERLAHLVGYGKNAIELVPRLLGAMLIGAGLYRSGFLTGGMSRKAYMVIALATLVVALGAQLGLARLAFRSEFAVPVMFGVSYAFPPLFQLMMAVSYAALIVMATRAFPKAIWARALAKVGRTSFSNYIGTSIVMTLLFNGYGLSLFGHVERAALWTFVFAGWTLMLILSNLCFAQGPLEWLWRHLAR